MPRRHSRTPARLWLFPQLQHLAWWLGPILVVGWAFSSGIGRSILLKRMVPGSNPEPGTLMQGFNSSASSRWSLHGLRLVWRPSLGRAGHPATRRCASQIPPTEPGRLQSPGSSALSLGRSRSLGACQLDLLDRSRWSQCSKIAGWSAALAAASAWER